MTVVDPLIIRCSACGVMNRVPAERLQESTPVCGRCKTPLPVYQAITITDANFLDEVERAAVPILIDMWAPWCGPCRAVTPIVEELAKEWAGRLRVGKMNVDDNPATSARFNVRSIPTLLLMKNGFEIDRIVGAVPKSEIIRRLAQAGIVDQQVSA